MVGKIITDVIAAVVQPFWFCLLLSFLFMFAYKQYQSFTAAVKQWFTWFRSEREFRRVFVLAFYVGLVLFRTLLNRGLQVKPLGDVWGEWLLPSLAQGDWKAAKNAFENLLMLIPFPILVFWAKGELLLKKRTLGEIIGKSALMAFCFSFGIEALQVVFFVGTWQVSDLVLNTLGGIIGGILYGLLSRRKKHNNQMQKEEEKDEKAELASE